jgi:phosphocarrier protein
MTEMNSVATARFTIINQLGLHARAATKLVQLASKFPCEVEVGNDDQKVNGKSVMGVLLLCGAKGTAIDVRAEGERSEECVRAIGELIANRFGEPR